MEKVFRALLLCLFSANASAAVVVPWTTAETAWFTGDPPEISSRATWSGDTLTLSYSSTLVNNTYFTGSTSYATFMPVGTGPSLASNFLPTDVVGLSFDFAHSGLFNFYSQVTFGYYLPYLVTNPPAVDDSLLGVNFGFRTLTSPMQSLSNFNCSTSNVWSPSLDNRNPCENDVTSTSSSGIDHVELYFTQDMLKYQDGFINMWFQSVVDPISEFGGVNPSTGLYPQYSGSATFSNVSWLVSPGSSESVDRWHLSYLPNNLNSGGSDAGNTVPEPTSIALLGLSLVCLIGMRKRFNPS